MDIHDSSTLARSASDEALILIVDDIPRNLQVLGSILSESGFGVSVASSGRSALEAIASQAPDVILLDIQMPDMDGYEVCRQLKVNPETAHIPVIFLTARTEIDDIVRGFEQGAVDYVTKPFISQELLVRVRTHLRLVRQTERLRELNKDKDEFLGIAAHDLRNPLSKIQFIAEKMAYKADIFTPELIQEASADIVGTVSEMMELISNLLDVNAIERGDLFTELNPIDIATIAEHVTNDYVERAAKKKIAVQYESVLANGATTLPFVISDEVAIVQILDNIISNAVKYSPPRTVITVRLVGGATTVRLEVQDEGPGISADDRKKMFQKFARLSAQPTGNEHSIGLGLSIVKRLVENIKATIEVQSEVGVGTTFMVAFPVANDESLM
jgi:two-component system, sensor histidine kinase and response regulator